MGGSIAMMVAARHPGSVGKVMVVDMLPFMGAMFGGPAATSANVTPIADGMMAQMAKASPEAREAAQTQMVRGMVNTEAEYPQVLKAALDSDRETVAPRLSRTDRHRPAVGTGQHLGADDGALRHAQRLAVSPPEQTDALHAASFANLKDAKLTRIPDSAHFIMYDARPDLLRSSRRS